MIGKVSIPNPPSPIGPRASGEQTGTRNRGVNPPITELPIHSSPISGSKFTLRLAIL